MIYAITILRYFSEKDKHSKKT